MTPSCEQLFTIGTLLKNLRKVPQNNMNGLLGLGKASFRTKVKWKLTWLFHFFIVLVLWMNSCEKQTRLSGFCPKDSHTFMKQEVKHNTSLRTPSRSHVY